MSVLILNASPHKNGTVASLLREVAGSVASGRGVEWIDAYDLRIQPCRGCLRCRPDGRCVLPEDDGHRIGEKMRLAESLVVGTPTHWANMSSQLKVLLDRNVPAFMGRTPRGLPAGRHKGKPAVVVAACSTPRLLNAFAGQSRGAVRAVREVLRCGGYRILRPLVFAGDMKNGLPQRILRRARAAGSRL